MANSLLRKKQLKPSLFFNNAETSFVEYLYSGNFITDIITWTDNLKTQKIQEESFTYANNKVVTIITKQYDRTGVLVETLTETLTYVGNNISTNDKVLT
jgi:hypothetical protein